MTQADEIEFFGDESMNRMQTFDSGLEYLNFISNFKFIKASDHTHTHIHTRSSSSPRRNTQPEGSARLLLHPVYTCVCTHVVFKAYRDDRCHHLRPDSVPDTVPELSRGKSNKTTFAKRSSLFPPSEGRECGEERRRRRRTKKTTKKRGKK